MTRVPAVDRFDDYVVIDHADDMREARWLPLDVAKRLKFEIGRELDRRASGSINVLVDVTDELSFSWTGSRRQAEEFLARLIAATAYGTVPMTG